MKHNSEMHGMLCNNKIPCWNCDPSQQTQDDAKMVNFGDACQE